MCDLLDLPLEILFLILAQLDYFTLSFTIPLVCRRFRSLSAPNSSPAIDDIVHCFNSPPTPILKDSKPTLCPPRINPLLALIVAEASSVRGVSALKATWANARLTSHKISLVNGEVELEDVHLPKSRYDRDNVAPPWNQSAVYPTTSSIRVILTADAENRDASTIVRDVKRLFGGNRPRTVGPTLGGFACGIMCDIEKRCRHPGKNGHFVFEVETGWETWKDYDGNVEEGKMRAVITLKLVKWEGRHLHDVEGGKFRVTTMYADGSTEPKEGDRWEGFEASFVFS